MNQDGIILSNDSLNLTLDFDKPVVTSYNHIPSGRTFSGGNEDGCLCINGDPIAWTRWTTSVDQDAESVTYRMYLSEKNLTVVWYFTLNDEMLTMRIDQVDDPDDNLHEIGWNDLPLLVCMDEGYSYWRMFTEPPEAEVGYKMWSTDAAGTVAELGTEPEPAPIIYGTIWNDKVCAFVDSNFPLFPISHQRRPDGAYAISHNTYQYRLRDQIMPPLEITVGFLSDTNGDGKADVSDYRLRINRSRPKGDPLYYDTVIYKIFMDLTKLGAGVCTDLTRSEEIIRAFHNISDGLPQIVYLVGLQAGGHDGTYPTLAGGGTKVIFRNHI